ncbi:MAG: hypothetical protein ACPL7K_09310, partial [Armatimonadota bacterium]
GPPLKACAAIGCPSFGRSSVAARAKLDAPRRGGPPPDSGSAALQGARVKVGQEDLSGRR